MEKLAEKVVFPVLFKLLSAPFLLRFSNVSKLVLRTAHLRSLDRVFCVCVVFVRAVRVVGCGGRESITFEYYSRDEWVKGPNLGCCMPKMATFRS